MQIWKRNGRQRKLYESKAFYITGKTVGKSILEIWPSFLLTLTLLNC